VEEKKKERGKWNEIGKEKFGSVTYTDIYTPGRMPFSGM
jgi:hypothetical protein